MWAAETGSSVETARKNDLQDPLAAAVNSSGDIYILVGTTLKVLPAGGTPSEFAVEEAQSVDAFFTAGAGRKCQSLSIGGHVLILGKNKMLLIDTVAKAVRVIEHSRWCLCSNSGEEVFFADAEGSVYRAQHRLNDEAFPGSPSIIHKFSGTATSVDGNSLEPVSDFVKDARYMMRPRDTGSVLKALCALPGSVLVCMGHGLLSFDLASGTERVVLKDERSASSFAFPSALFVAGSTVLAQCADGLRQTLLGGGTVSLVLPAGDMVFKEDPGSPEPCPKDVIGLDAKYIYFFTERDFHVGCALRRWPHGLAAKPDPRLSGKVVVEPAPAGGMEMKVTAKKGARFYERSAETMLQGVPASTGADGQEVAAAKPAVQNLRISALGNAIDVAVFVAGSMEKRGLAQFRRVQTSYTQMDDASVPQIWIDLEKL